MKLVIEQDGQRKTFQTESHELYVGRAPENEIVVKDQRSSERHCRIFRVDSSYHLSDLKSEIGTRVNGRQVKEAVLRPGDRIEIGDARILFEPPAAQASTKPAYFIEAIEGNLAGKKIDIGSEPITFGRHKKNRVVLTDPGVSNYHAILTLDSGGPTVTDLSSTNGSRVNGKKVERQTLNPGDHVAFMAAVFVLHDRNRLEASTAPPAAPDEVEKKQPPSRKPVAAKASSESMAATDPGDEVAPPEEDVIEFDYEMLLEETSGTSIPQTVGIVVILLLILSFGYVVLRGMVVRPPTDPSPEDNLVSNWSFEQEGGWIFATPEDGGFDEAEARSGRRSLRLDLDAAGPDGASCHSDGSRSVQSHRRLRARAWVKADGQSIGGLRLRWFTEEEGDESRVSLASLAVAPSDWEEVQGSFIPPRGATRVRVECFGIGDGSIWIDRVQLVEWEEESPVPEVASSATGIRLRIDEKGVAEIWRDGVLFVEGMDLQVGDRMFGNLQAATPGRLDEDGGLSLGGEIYLGETGHWVGYSFKAQEGDKGISIIYSLAKDRLPPRLRLRFTVKMRGVGGQGPRVGPASSPPETVSWILDERVGTDLTFGARKRTLALSFSSPLKISSVIEDGRAAFTLEADPSELVQGDRVLLTILASPVSPTEEDRVFKDLETARGLVANGPWAEALRFISRLEDPATSIPDVVKEAKVMRKEIEAESARGADEIDGLILDYENLRVPELIGSALAKLDRQLELWGEGTEASKLGVRREELLAMQKEVDTGRSGAEAARLYAQGRAEMDAGRFHLASMVYSHIKETYPDADVISQVDIDLQHIEKVSGE
ncbi:MAG: FHA domain-containing protein [Planctomycetota bacterium]|nr:FHA domain-containing protein [Planctomycetota bacterium]